ncbi:glycosyltransferase family 4 protein [Lentithecium fluviatile CBS 122367]|uniref:Glycosyltransferase family 4 protein n=1 Tax=Lentithecium fluviatile CBS 122367 TaxID=1168545 RepID=A0A6G1JL17_9PLEO|nr:glycosyltransferase family 4 protein [Lentithecium fluviatile CBS 122367]
MPRGQRDIDSGSESDASGTSTPTGARSPSFTPISTKELPNFLADFLIGKLKEYQEKHLYKYIGAGINQKAVQYSPQLPSRLWQELDIVPLVLDDKPRPDALSAKRVHKHIYVDEEADTMVRKALMYFGPSSQPRLAVGYKNLVKVDCSGRVVICSADDFRNSVRDPTWKATMKYIESLKKNNVQIAFFNSTPQGGGVALMRHALIRFLRTMKVDASWYVPKPKPAVFRITKNNHNILQGVADPELRLTHKQIATLDEWARSNAERFWLPEDCPLAPRSQGGADVVIVDDPQMPSLVKIAKQQDPTRPVIFRSHIQVRADLADQEDTPTSEVWNWVWNNVKDADVFVSHPVREFVPSNVTVNKVGYMPATTDWLDGLNKQLSDWDSQYYIRSFRADCFKVGMDRLAYPARQYIVQIARFDPAKGIPDVLAAYAELRRVYMKDTPIEDIPQLVIAGHGAIDDPDATCIYDETLSALEQHYSDIREDVVVMRLGPTDQLLNALMSNAHVALQLSTREGFEVKVSEALHKGVPTIATRAGGIPLQVQHRKSGYLVDPGDYQAVARHLNALFTDATLYDEMSHFAENNVSDEVSTVGNALAWLYLADSLAKGETVEPNCQWVNDLARETAGVPYTEGEVRLPRGEDLDLHSPVASPVRERRRSWKAPRAPRVEVSADSS